MQCRAKRKNGTPCKNDAIQGGRVCRMHGGGAPQVKKAAALRLAALMDPAISVVEKAMRDYSKDRATALRAAFGSMDRNGYGPHSKHELVGKDGESLIDFEAIDALIHGTPAND